MMTLYELNKILDDHKKWLKGSGGNRADLSGMDLRGMDLRGVDLSSAKIRGTDLRETDLRETILYGADLTGAEVTGTYLSCTNLRRVDLRGANIDFSCWPLWCGSLDVKVDARIARQLAYHFCRLDCDDPEYLEARRAVMGFANKFHRVDECGQIKEQTNDER